MPKVGHGGKLRTTTGPHSTDHNSPEYEKDKPEGNHQGEPVYSHMNEGKNVETTRCKGDKTENGQKVRGNLKKTGEGSP